MGEGGFLVLVMKTAIACGGSKMQTDGKGHGAMSNDKRINRYCYAPYAPTRRCTKFKASSIHSLKYHVGRKNLKFEAVSLKLCT